MLILVIIMRSLFDPCCCFWFCAFLYMGQTDIKEIGSERVEFEITSPTSKKKKKKKPKTQISCDLNELG